MSYVFGKVFCLEMFLKLFDLGYQTLEQASTCHVRSTSYDPQIRKVPKSEKTRLQTASYL